MILFKDAKHRFFNPVLAAALLVSIGSTAAYAEGAVDEEGGGSTIESVTGVPVHGFANMGYAEDSSNDAHRRFARGFYLNNFDLYYSPDLGNRVRFLSEVVFEPDAESQQPTFDAERLQAGYVISKNLTAWVGRFHTPIGYYVTAYHHGMILQTAVEKPRFLDFEDHYGVLPVHTNGLWLNGNFIVGEQRFGVMAWAGNSDRMVTDGSGFTALDFNMVHQDYNHLALGARFQWNAGGSLDGLAVGATVLHETVDYLGTGSPTYGVDGNGNGNPGVGNMDMTSNPNNGFSTFSSDFLMWGVHAVYEARNFEFLNEAYFFNNSNLSDKGSPSYKSYAGYSQLAYWINGTMAPYARYERAAFNLSDPYFNGQYNGLPYTKYAAGFRYSLNDNAAVKIELSSINFGGSSATNEGQSYRDIHLDYSIRF